MPYRILSNWSLRFVSIPFLFTHPAIDFLFNLIIQSGMTSSGTTGTTLFASCLIFQLSGSGMLCWHRWRHKHESKTVQALVRPTFGSETPSFPLHSIDQNKAVVSPGSGGRGTDTTSSWEEQHSPIAKGIASGNNEIFGPVLWLTYLR